MKKAKSKKDSFYAKFAFYLSLGFWIPLFNVAICITSLILAIMALKKQYREPEMFGGTGYAVAAMILSLTSIVLTVVGLILWLLSDNICASSICRLYYEATQ